MADAAPAPDATDLEPIYRQLLQQALTQQQPWQQPQTPVERSGVSLLGEALGGGSQYGSPAERESAGTRALLSLGVGMLGASGYSPVRRTLGEVVATGIGGAQESLARSGSVAAAQLGAQQEYAQKQQEMQLARVKEAVPLLTALQTLQQQKRLAGLSSSLTPGTTPGTSIGSVGGDTYEGAIGGHEGTGKNPNSSALGTGQFLESTWQAFAAANPELFKGMTPAQVLAARTDTKLGTQAITWLAQQNADALTKAGVTPSGPSLGIAHYLGAGAAAKVMQAPDNAPVSGFVSDAAVKANPELATMTVGQLKQRYANTPAPAFLAAAKPGAPGAPPAVAPTVAADGKPVGDPTKPELAPGPPGSAVSGPPTSLAAAVAALSAGKPQYTVAPPPQIRAQPIPAGRGTTAENVQADVEAMQAGRQIAQGGPTPGAVLAAGPAAGTPPAVVATAAPQGGFTAGAGAYGGGPATTTPPPAPAPQAPSQASPAPTPAPAAVTASAPGGPSAPFVVPEPPQQVRDTFATTLTPAEEGEFQHRFADAQRQFQIAQASANPKGMEDAQKEISAVRQAMIDARIKRYEIGTKAQQDWNAAALAAHNKNIEQQQTFDQQSRLKEIEGQQTRLTNKEAVFNSANQKGLELAQTDQAAARGVVAQLEGFRNISESVGQPGWLQTTKWPGSDHTIAEQLQQAGIPIGDTGGAQLLKGGMINIVKALREGMPMGSLSDRDLAFIERMGPTEWMDPDTRAAAIGYLLQANRAKMAFARDVQKEMSRGKNYGDAVDAVDARAKPFVPQVPADLTAHWKDDSPEWKQRRMEWGQQNDAGPGTLIHMDDGRIVVLKRPPSKDRGQG